MLLTSCFVVSLVFFMKGFLSISVKYTVWDIARFLVIPIAETNVVQGWEDSSCDGDVEMEEASWLVIFDLVDPEFKDVWWKFVVRIFGEIGYSKFLMVGVFILALAVFSCFIFVVVIIVFSL